MPEFLKEAEQEHKVIKKIYKEMESSLHEAIKWFAMDPRKVTTEDFFTYFVKFILHFEKARKENLQIRELKKKEAHKREVEEAAKKKRESMKRKDDVLVNSDEVVAKDKKGLLDDLLSKIVQGEVGPKKNVQKKNSGHRPAIVLHQKQPPKRQLSAVDENKMKSPSEVTASAGSFQNLSQDQNASPSYKPNSEYSTPQVSSTFNTKFQNTNANYTDPIVPFNISKSTAPFKPQPPMSSSYNVKPQPQMSSSYNAKPQPPMSSSYNAKPQPTMSSSYNVKPQPTMSSSYSNNPQPPITSYGIDPNIVPSYNASRPTYKPPSVIPSPYTSNSPNLTPSFNPEAKITPPFLSNTQASYLPNQKAPSYNTYNQKVASTYAQDPESYSKPYKTPAPRQIPPLEMPVAPPRSLPQNAENQTLDYEHKHVKPPAVNPRTVSQPIPLAQDDLNGFSTDNARPPVSDAIARFNKVAPSRKIPSRNSRNEESTYF